MDKIEIIVGAEESKELLKFLSEHKVLEKALIQNDKTECFRTDPELIKTRRKKFISFFVNPEEKKNLKNTLFTLITEIGGVCILYSEGFLK